MIKILSKVGIQGSYLNIIEALQPTSDSMGKN